MTTYAIWIRPMLRAAVLLAAIGAAGCTTKKTEAPALSGPSEFGQSISVTATPDRISQDGVSQVRVEATIRDSQSKPSQGVAVQWTVDASTGTLVEPSLQQTVTDASGRAVILVTAPRASGRPAGHAGQADDHGQGRGNRCGQHDQHQVGGGAAGAAAGTLPPNRLPDAAFTISPAIGNINQEIGSTPAARRTRASRAGRLCTYQWDFGDFETESGQHVTKPSGRPGPTP